MTRAVGRLNGAARAAVGVVLPALLAVVASSWALAVESPLDAARFQGSTDLDAGAVALVQRFGGQYVYTAQPAPAPLLTGRLALGGQGRALRDDFELLSGEEEQALWGMREHQREQLRESDRERQRTVDAATVRLAPARGEGQQRLARRALQAVQWPRVVEVQAKTCVPVLAFAQSDDWREHLVCWMKEQRRVE